MNFFKDRDLASRLRNDQVSSKEKLIYLLVFLLFISFALSIASCSKESNHIENFVFAIMETIGLIICYQTNQKGDGKNFIERYICLGFPICIRAIVMTIAMVIIVLLITAVVTICVLFTPLIELLPEEQTMNKLFSELNNEDSFIYSVFSFIFSAFFCIYFYIRMKKSIKIAATEIKIKLK